MPPQTGTTIQDQDSKSDTVKAWYGVPCHIAKGPVLHITWVSSFAKKQDSESQMVIEVGFFFILFCAH